MNPGQFADELGIQRSNISHILSERNKPSLDLVQKILLRFKYINTDWLIFGKGEMIKQIYQQSLFPELDNQSLNQIKSEDSVTNNAIQTDNYNIANFTDNEKAEEIILNKESNNSFVENPIKAVTNHETKSNNTNGDSVIKKKIEKIIILYSDKSFTDYLPE